MLQMRAKSAGRRRTVCSGFQDFIFQSRERLLDGNRAINWNELVPPGKFNDKRNRFITGFRQAGKINGARLPAHGIATYRLVVRPAARRGFTASRSPTFIPNTRCG